MAEIIEFYVTQRFQKHRKWVPEPERGKIMEFPLENSNAAADNCAVDCLPDAAEVHRLFEIFENR